MSIIEDIIYEEAKKNSNYLRKWNDESIIPAIVMGRLWDIGIRLRTDRPKHGMKLINFLELVWKRYLALRADPYIGGSNKSPRRKQLGIKNKDKKRGKPRGIKPHKIEVGNLCEDYYSLFEDTVEHVMNPPWKHKIKRKKNSTRITVRD